MYSIIPFFNYTGVVLGIMGAIILVIALLQLNTNLSPFPSPKSTTQLIQSGLYGYIRHPIYTGILLIAFGIGLYIGSLFKIVVFLALYVVFYNKSLYEEQRLALFFPNYSMYKKKTGRFIPKIRKDN